jgi:hypothetical protein
MIVIMAAHGARAEGPAFRIERRLDRPGVAAQAFDHLPDDMVFADAQAVSQKLRRQMAVAEMPCDPHEPGQIRRGNLDKLLRRRSDAHDSAVAQNKPVAITERRCSWKIEQEGQARLSGHREPTAMTTIEV